MATWQHVKQIVQGRVEEGKNRHVWRLGREEEGEMDIFGDYKQTEMIQTDGNPMT